MIDYKFVTDTLAAGVLLAIPLTMASLGEIISERAGVINIGIEGYMLLGTMAGYMGAYFTGNAWTGILVAIAGSTILSLLHAFISVSLRSDQLVSGIGINILTFGLTSFLYRISPMGGLKPTVPSFKPWNLPYLSDIPVIGSIFFRHPPLVYVGFLLIPLTFYLLYKTPFGLRLRAVGEDPLAAETMGINVTHIRYICVALCGAFSGMAGAFLSLSYLSMFIEGMTAGRGFIALAAVIVAGWDPVKALIICLLFGFADSLQLRLQIMGTGIPYSFLMMIPYLMTITILIAKGRVFVPKALGIPYRKVEE